MTNGKILIVGDIYSRNRYHNSKNFIKNEYFIACGFQELGLECLIFDWRDINVNKIRLSNIDYVIFITNQYKLYTDLIDLIECALSEGIQIAYWNTEGWPHWYRNNIKPFTNWPIRFFSSWPLPIKYTWHTQGVNLPYWPILHENNNKDIDILFLGSPYNDYRKKIIEDIQKYYNIKIISNAFGNIASKLISRSKIVLGIGYSHNDKGYSNRVYNTLAAGGCFLTQYVKLMDNEFERDKDLIYWSSVGELHNKIRFLLNSDELRNYISQNGHRNVINFHQYKHKCLLLLVNMEAGKYESSN